MTMGTLIHELVQKVLTQQTTDVKQIRIEAENIIKESVQMLFDAGLSEEEAKNNMQAYIPPLAEFMQTYVAKKPTSSYSKVRKIFLTLLNSVCLHPHACDCTFMTM